MTIGDAANINAQRIATGVNQVGISIQFQVPYSGFRVRAVPSSRFRLIPSSSLPAAPIPASMLIAFPIGVQHAANLETTEPRTMNPTNREHGTGNLEPLSIRHHRLEGPQRERHEDDI